MKKILVVLFVISILSGCAAVKTNTSKPYKGSDGSKLSLSIEKGASVVIPNDQYDLLESVIKKGLEQKTLLASKDQPNYSLKVKITHFRMRDDLARLTVGIMAGCDKIDSTVIVTDNFSGEVIGESNVRINECAAWGVAAQVIEKYAKGVVSFVSK